LNLRNLARTLDPALVALIRSCPYYAGRATGLAASTTWYRGDPEFAPGVEVAWWLGEVV
jgi:gamma-glutamyl:cysteine ligase YbdK (ATP-grasp superfamily)